MNPTLGSLILLAVAAFWPVWRWYWVRMSDGSDEPWGILALVSGIALLYVHRKYIKLSKGTVVASALLLVIYSFSQSVASPMVSAVMALLCLGCLSGTILRLPSLWGLFLISLPVLASLQFYVGYPMRMVAAILAENFLRICQLDVVRQGTDLLYGNQTVGVDPPCSGIEMLWVGLYITLATGAFQRWSLIRTLALVILTIGGVICANSLRVTLLFFKESGIVTLPEWTHEGIGVLLFALLVFFFGRFSSEHRDIPVTTYRMTTRQLAVFVSVMLIAAVMPLLDREKSSRYVGEGNFPGWPETYEGHYLEEIPLSPIEKRFAGDFPGKLGIFRAGHDKVIFRWVQKPTRKLHPASDCLKAAGYEIESEKSGGFFAFSHDGESGWFVEEEIFNESERWPEISSWFWSSLFSRAEGPWWAVTRIQPLAL
ncbi:MAG: archaeosortase/exosortase family protein [Verrucomicrobiales bacterium]|nr:archaeosortase/exosortase family protein [Verrucomicrobiales bacterium]